MQILRARLTLARGGEWIDGGGIAVDEGRVVSVLRSPRALDRWRGRATRTLDLGEVALTPGLVNAHAHLELSGLRGLLPRGADFGAWIARLRELRAARTVAELARDARSGADRCLATGTTAVGDIDYVGGSLRGLRRSPLRVRLYRELLDAGDPQRTAAAIARAREAASASKREFAGLAPHSPFTASPELLAESARIARRARLPVTVHWSETREEIEWLLRGRGPIAKILTHSPRQSGSSLLARAGLLRRGTSLVHGNHPSRGEPQQLAKAGVVLVHCPGCHAFFGRAPFPIERYLRAGVALALGTDSLASNDDLDLRREMALLRGAHPGVAPSTVWEMATRGGARALGWGKLAGELSPGAWADCVAFACVSSTGAGALEEITSGQADVRGVWIAGRRRHP